jgi:hypothetical protein
LIGIEGESDIVAILEGIPFKQAILRNVYLPHPTDRGAFTEIDILYIAFISETNGIFGKSMFVKYF